MGLKRYTIKQYIQPIVGVGIMRIRNVNQVVSWEVIGTEKRGVNPIWWLFWLIVFFPILIFVFFIHNQEAELIRLNYRNGDEIIIKLVQDDVNWFMKKMKKIGAYNVKKEDPQLNLKKCPYCAEMIKNEAVFCRYCHNSLVESVLDKTSDSMVNDCSSDINAQQQAINKEQSSNVGENTTLDYQYKKDSYNQCTAETLLEEIKQSKKKNGWSDINHQSLSLDLVKYKPLLKVLFLIIGVIIFSIVKNQKSYQAQSQSIETTIAQINECKSLIYSHNRYDPQRMEYVETKLDGSIILKYHRTTSNSTWTLRCLKGTPQVWAKGSQMWIDI